MSSHEISNKISERLHELPTQFARTVVATYLAGLDEDEQDEILHLVASRINKKPNNIIRIHE